MSEGQHSADEPAESVVRRRKGGWRRILSIVAIALLALVVAALIAVWMARRPIAERVLEREFERRGVQATYELERVGLRTQQVRNLVIGDPQRPDLVARFAQIQLRVKWDGSVEVYRIVARGVRLRGRLRDGRVSWGQIDRLLPPPSDKPFALPSFVVDVADTSISLATPYGPFGFAVEGRGNLSGGFKGRLAVRSPYLTPGRCRVSALRANVAVEVVARRPHVEGPVSLDRLNCPESNFDIVDPLFDVDSRFNESFTNFEGRGRMAIRTLTAGENGLAAFTGNLGFEGDMDSVSGTVALAARQSRMASIYAERTRLSGRYRLGYTSGSFVMIGDYAANGATLNQQMVAGITDPLAAASGTPIGPVAAAVGNAISRTVRNFDAAGQLRMVNSAGGGAVRIDSANVRAASGARVAVSGGDGITYYWPSGRIRIDGDVAMSGGGLPNGRVRLRQPRNGAPMSGIAEFAPYSAGGSRLAMAPIRFTARRDGSTEVSTVALVDGPISDGRIQALRVPINGRLGAGGGLTLGMACEVVSFQSLQLGGLRLGATRLPVCPIGNAILSTTDGGAMRVGATFERPSVSGFIGDSPLRVQASSGRFQDKSFAFDDFALRLGQSQAPIIFDANRLQGTFRGSGIGGTFSGGRSTVGNVPLEMSGIAGDWLFYQGDLTVNGGLTVSDRNPDPRFYPLRSDDMRFVLTDEMVRASGSLRHPESGTHVTDVDIEHRLASGSGRALLDVPGLTFGQGLQPEELTRLTEGVVALVQGTVSGQGRINWTSEGEVRSSGEFSTAGMDLAAPFGPVRGMSGTIRFDDLLGLTTAPGQTMTIESINPGILVENGVIRYQLLPNQLVKIERGEWPFMGGRLILQETILNFGRPSAKRLTFEVVGLNAHTFVESLGFDAIEATGIFDGVLPMIFDERGGRIVGGRLESRPPGGSLSYVGAVNKADLGTMGNIAFNALRDLRFRSMIIRLDGDLAGEFAARLAIDGVALGQTNSTQKIIRGLLARIPLKLNVNITGPFRALIATAKSVSDPRLIIADVLPVPLDDIPGITTEVIRREEESSQTQTPVEEDVDVTATPPAESER